MGKKYNSHIKEIEQTTIIRKTSNNGKIIMSKLMNLMEKKRVEIHLTKEVINSVENLRKILLIIMVLFWLKMIM